ncbi:MAG TPA: glucokinase [Chlamydiales bacterium]|nr:glucokinase [Chlamydiales bacterium]
MILVGDVGGTHTRLAFFEKGKKISDKKYPSRKYPGLELIIKEFMQSEGKTASKACFGIAGAVLNGKCKATNLPWVLDEAQLSHTFQIQTKLLNDLETNAHGLHLLKKEDLYSLQTGNSGGQGNRALVSAGTGLGEAGLYWDGKKHHPFASEGGHSDFAPRNNEEIALFQYLKNQFDHVSYERVVSGPGLYNIFRFLVDTNQSLLSPEVKMEMEQRDPAMVVSEWGVKNKDRTCAKALDWFVSIYGAEVGNVALRFSALGGIYLGGGIAPHILERLKGEGFLSSFISKGRFRSLLQTIPIQVVLNDDTGLIGAAAFVEDVKP